MQTLKRRYFLTFFYGTKMCIVDRKRKFLDRQAIDTDEKIINK